MSENKRDTRQESNGAFAAKAPVNPKDIRATIVDGFAGMNFEQIRGPYIPKHDERNKHKDIERNNNPE